ncbi:hypothetical protein AWM70_17115 [Paenibacillus yonginensis]|uniref:DUF115 domain-containing protein n=1 Tax=Paenibacillus yonginensis TaxID=1462996 RepID=A0A1B1N3T4_9BACL|nr:6-hydroxymethylpterin diphosphokinase MptE-like protein [Paenibacillus yonginensis]ANS76090.1 hypothetical protein AWM70_17115 [Paenibacillus yonginensis]
MNYYKTNLEFLKVHYPNLVPLLEGHSAEIENYSTRMGEPNIMINIGDRVYPLHSRFNATEEARKWTLTLEKGAKESKHAFILGTGLGYFLESYLEFTKVKDIFIYEPSITVFKSWLYLRDVRTALSDKRIRLIAIGEDEHLFILVAKNLAEQISGAFVKVTPPIYERKYPELIRRFDNYLKDMIIQQISDMQTRQENKVIWLTNILNNMQYIASTSSILALKGVLLGKGVKAVVVGSGPSLKKDIHLLPQLKEKCIIIAAGSSIQAMESYGISPHFVISMDGSLSNYNVFENINTANTSLIFLPPINYLITESYKGEMFHAKFQSDSIISYLVDPEDEIPKFISTSTVTGTAIQLAEYMGIEEVVLMGQDLSFPDNEYYAPGVNHISTEDKEARISQASLWVDNVEGGKNRTKGSMQVLLKDIQVLVQVMKLRGVSIINTSKKGAIIEGTEWISLEELLPQLNDLSFDPNDLKSLLTPVGVVQRNEKLKVILNNLNKVILQVSKIEIKSKKLLEKLTDLRQAAAVYNHKRIEAIINEINEIWNWITSKEVFNVFYDYSLAHYTNIYMRNVSEIVETTDLFKKAKLIEEHLGNLVKQIVYFNPELKSALESALNRISSEVNTQL